MGDKKMNIEVANRLVEFRKKNGLSQEQLAEKIGVSRQAVSKWERSEASPDTDNLIMLARLYNVSLDELLKTEEDIPMPEKEEPKQEDSPRQAALTIQPSRQRIIPETKRKTSMFMSDLTEYTLRTERIPFI